MKLRNQFLKYKLHCIDGDDGAGGGDNGGGDAGGVNTDDANLLSHETMWDTAENTDSNANDNGGQQQQQSTEQVQSPADQFNAHIDTLNFMDGIDIRGAMTAIQNNDEEAFGGVLKSLAVNGYKNAMIDSNKAAQFRIDASASAVKSEINASTATGEVVNAMNGALPFTRSPQFAPVAKLLLTQFMTKGAKPEKAIEEVGKYFQNLSGELGKLTPAAPNSQASGGFNGNMQQNSDANKSGDVDWLEMLGGAPQT